MRVVRLVAAALALAVANSASAQTFAPITYTLTPIMREGALQAVQFDVTFRGEPDGNTTLRLPDSWGGQDELYRGIDALSVVSGATLADGADPAHRVLTHRPNARIHLRYRVIQDWQGAPNAQQGNSYRPVIQPTYFHLIGDAVLVAPEGYSLLTPVRLRTRNIPRGWVFASDLQHPGLTLGRMQSSVTVGGDFRVLRSADRSIQVVMRGDWRFTDEDFSAETDRIITGQRAFWGDAPSPYLVTVLQLTNPNTGALSIGGTGLGDAFAFFATPNAEAAPITRTLAHESLHTWIPGLIGGMREEEAADYWLSEGFTDFYTGRLLVRDGVWTPRQFADDLNDMLMAYGQSPVRTEPNTRIVADFWNDQNVEKLPYQRGRLLATIWDARLRGSGRDLDNIVIEMRDRARGGDPLKAAAMFPIVAEGMGLDVSADIASYVTNGATISLPEDIFAPCGRITTRQAQTFHRGFDIAATQANNNTITGVDPALPAYAAGMRDGMTLIRRVEGQVGDASRQIAYLVRDGDTERTFRYMPTGHGTFTLQQLELAETLEGERLAQCVRVLSGG